MFLSAIVLSVHTLIAFVPNVGAQAQQAVPDDHTLLTRQDFVLPILVEPGNASKIQKILFYCSTDKGQSWTLVSEHAPTDGTIDFRAPKNGVYWFAIQTLLVNGDRNPPTKETLSAAVKVVVEAQTVAAISKASPVPNENLSKENLEMIKKGLRSDDKERWKAAMAFRSDQETIMNSLIEDIISETGEGKSSQSALNALELFSKNTNYETRLLKLRDSLRAGSKARATINQTQDSTTDIAKTQAAAIQSGKLNVQDSAVNELTRMLFFKEPEKYADEVIGVLHMHLLNQVPLGPSANDTALEDIALLAIIGKKKALMPLVPLILDNMTAVAQPTRKRAHLALVALTGRYLAFDANGSPAECGAVAEQYRKILTEPPTT